MGSRDKQLRIRPFYGESPGDFFLTAAWNLLDRFLKVLRIYPIGHFKLSHGILSRKAPHGTISNDMDTQTFFREATLRICGSLDVEKFLYDSFMYIRDVIPADQVALMYLDFNPGIPYSEGKEPKQVLLAEASEEGGRLGNISVPQPQEVFQFATNPETPAIFHLERAEDSLITRPWIAKGYLAPQASILTLRLVLEGELIGAVTWISNTPARFTRRHAKWLELLREPFAIALSNSKRYTELQQFKDLLVEDNRFLRKELLESLSDDIIGADSGLSGVMTLAKQVAPLVSPVLLLGETGSGKEVIAGAIHSLSTRSQGPFITVNCGAIPDNLMDSELFGHEKGAFTGAVCRKKGRFERAHGGTIFLDEIGELQPDAQVRLLRVLQEKEIERVGGAEAIPVDIRVIAATHRDLHTMIGEGTFREDLFFRLNVFPLMIPPLRERAGDIPALLRHFLHKKAQEMGRKMIPPLESDVIDRLCAYSWPGNVRELQNAVERELIINQGHSLRFQEIIAGASSSPSPEQEILVQECSPPQSVSDVRALDEVISRYIRQVLKLTQGKVGGKGGAADLLRINPSTLRKRMRKLGIAFGRTHC